MEAATVEIDGAIQSAARSLAIAMFGSGSGRIGQIDATTVLTSQTIQLAQIESVTNFEVGQTLVVSATDGTGTVKAGTIVVDGVDRDLGTVHVTAVLNSAITTIAANDFIFVQGDYAQKIKGFAAWLPATAPSLSDNFFSVNRSSDATRLAGIRYNGSSMPIEEALIGAASRVAREGGKPTHCVMSYDKFSQLEKELGTKVRYMDLTVKNYIGFRGIVVNGPRGPINVYADQNCPTDVAYMLQLDVWKLYSLGKAPKILDTDGLKMLRDSNADSVEIRVGYYAQLGCRAPGYNARIQF